MPHKSFTDQHGPSRNPRAHRNPREPRFLLRGAHANENPGGLLLDWKPLAEAKAMFHLYETNQLSFEGAKKLILLSDAQLRELLSDKVALVGVLHSIQDMRLKCWTIFVRYVKGRKK
jgi:hypothetical protein